MSLQLVTNQSIGSPNRFVLEWDDFAAAVMDVTLEAYHRFYAEITPSTSWFEDRYTVHLVQYMRRVHRERSLNWYVNYQHDVLQQAILAGQKPPKAAPRIDITFSHVFAEYERNYFAFECKLVADSRYNGRDLPRDYVVDGMCRFIGGKYSNGVPVAGMIGYVLSGHPTGVAHAINGKMMRSYKGNTILPLSKSHYLKASSSQGSSPNVFESDHKRPKQAPIRLYHIFLTFSGTAGVNSNPN